MIDKGTAIRCICYALVGAFIFGLFIGVLLGKGL